ncbi:hypothetical protein LCGC14_1142120 [marine sediment metagenome]|uniref:Uncharacterized protein n=1 Tax=marine sediment metagenome TaxID=412755 RepID=A0A0F9MKZ9_9ZZZZ
MSENRNIILFTGQSGIKVKKCIERIKSKIEREIKTVSVQDYIVESDVEVNDFREFLTKDIFYQVERWNEAFKKGIKDIDKKMIFLSMHSVYSSHSTGEIFSPLNFETLSALRNRIKLLIVFIDDIYDIFRRLTEKDQIFAEIVSKKTDQLDAILQSINSLFFLLEWRQSEIATSRLISNTLGISMFIIATKHPISIVQRLIEKSEEELKIYYIAHPITSIRESDEKVIPDFGSWLNTDVRKIFKEENSILFLPGTIDELRIKDDKKQDVFFPELLRRLNLPYRDPYNITPPMTKRLKLINPLNPFNYDVICSEPSVKQSISSLLRSLYNSIKKQITSRDLNIINQSKDGVIAYRPYYPDHISDGVRSELEYNFQLKRKQSRRKNLILSVNEDIGRKRIKAFFTFYSSSGEKLTPDQEDKLQDICDLWCEDQNILRIFFDKNNYAKQFENLIKKVSEIMGDIYRPKTDADEHRTFIEPIYKKRYEQIHKNFDKLEEDLFKDIFENYIDKDDFYYKYDWSEDLNINELIENYFKK